MTRARIDFPSRVSVRGVGAGVISAYALMVLFELLAGGVNWFRFDLTGIPEFGPGFWISMFVAWPLSLFVGGYISAVASRSTTERDGKLQGFLTWATSCTIGYAILFFFTENMLAVAYGSEVPSTYLLGAFISTVVAIIAAVYGGLYGAVDESKVSFQEEKSSRETFQEAG